MHPEPGKVDPRTQVPPSTPFEPQYAKLVETVTISVPESLEVNLVDASQLSEYEIWALLTSISSSAVVGFFVGYLQAAKGTENLWVAIMTFAGAVLALSGLMLFFKRRRLYQKKRRVEFRLSEMMERH